MKYIAPLLLLLVLASCSSKPGLKPRIKLSTGDTYTVKLDVEMKNRTKVMIVNAGSEKQRFILNTEWKVERIEDDSIYVIAATIQSFKLQLNEKPEVNIGIPDTLKNRFPRIALDTIADKMKGAVYQFKLSHHGEIIETTGADSAIYKAFVQAYGTEVPDSVYRFDFAELKSYCGNSSLSDYTKQLFSAFPSASEWREGDDYYNEIELNKFVESANQDIQFYCRNEWTCKGRDKNGDVVLNAKGRFSDRSSDERNQAQVGFSLKIEGAQEAGVSFDTLMFMPQRAEIRQQYKMSLGVTNIIFNMNFGSTNVNRTIVYQLTPVKK
ncbi:MAG: DUF6263 family protein [Bacteroidota bacterium]|jgi:hypothetical protein